MRYRWPARATRRGAGPRFDAADADFAALRATATAGLRFGAGLHGGEVRHQPLGRTVRELGDVLLVRRARASAIVNDVAAPALPVALATPWVGSKGSVEGQPVVA